jgi:DNA (cytosine-5)-methyltransferase 1
MRFVDLFSGLGGFHVALGQLGHHCVFACEIDETLRSLYYQNFGLKALGDIREIDPGAVPCHDILCAGFPCQPFSKAGDQQGLKCPRWGGLFENVLSILRHHFPMYLILENVPNLARHDGGKTWEGMKARLEALGYTVQDQRYSPHQFGIPQIRDRIYIVGSLSGLDAFEWPKPEKTGAPDIRSMLSAEPENARKLSPMVGDCLEVWQDFLRRFPKDEELPSYPIWSMEFGATYPYETSTPHAVGLRRLCRYRGIHGLPLGNLAPAQRMGGLPSYARVEESTFPKWKVEFIRKNRDLYARHRKWLEEWMPSVLRFPSSLQKLEWNCKGGERDIWQYV